MENEKHISILAKEIQKYNSKKVETGRGTTKTFDEIKADILDTSKLDNDVYKVILKCMHLLEQEHEKEKAEMRGEHENFISHAQAIHGVLQETIAKLKEELELERMRHAACGVIALSNTPESLAENRKMNPEYLSASVQNCINMAEREIQLKAQIGRLEFMIENGLGAKDMINDIKPPQEI